MSLLLYLAAGASGLTYVIAISPLMTSTINIRFLELSSTSVCLLNRYRLFLSPLAPITDYSTSAQLQYAFFMCKRGFHSLFVLLDSKMQKMPAYSRQSSALCAREYKRKW